MYYSLQISVIYYQHLTISGEDCKKKFKYLKDEYRKAQQKIPQPAPGAPAEKHVPNFKYFKMMRFLRETLQRQGRTALSICLTTPIHLLAKLMPSTHRPPKIITSDSVANVRQTLKTNTWKKELNFWRQTLNALEKRIRTTYCFLKVYYHMLKIFHILKN